jgi:hypothetical protein
MLILNGSCHFVHEEYGENYPTFINTELTFRFNFDFDGATLSPELLGGIHAGYTIRYVVELYDAATKERKERMVLTPYELSSGEKQYTIRDIKLSPIRYYVLAWVDIVPASTDTDYYYHTQNGLESVRLTNLSAYKGSTVARDAFSGRADMDFTVYDGQFDAHTEVTIDLERPLGMYVIFVNDCQAYFAAHSAQGENVPVGVCVRYISGSDLSSPYFRDGYNVNQRVVNHLEERLVLYEDQLVIRPGDEELMLAFDYILVTRDRTPLPLAIDLSDASGNVITTHLLSVPLEQNRQTVIKDAFFTQKEGGGIIIHDQFDDAPIIIELP